MAKLDGMNPERVRELLGEIQRACTTMRRVEAEVTRLLSRAEVPVQVTHHPRKVADDLETMARQVNERLALLEKQEKTQADKGKPAASKSDKVLPEPDITKPAEEPKPDKQQPHDGAKADQKADGETDHKTEQKVDDKAGQKAEQKADDKTGDKPEKADRHQSAAAGQLTQVPPDAGDRGSADPPGRDPSAPNASGPGTAGGNGTDQVVDVGAGAADPVAAARPAAPSDQAHGGVMTCQCGGTGVCQCCLISGTGAAGGATAVGVAGVPEGSPSGGSQVVDTPGKDHPDDSDPAPGQRVIVVDGVKVVSTPMNQPGPEASGAGAGSAGVGPRPDGPPGSVEPLEPGGSASGSAASGQVNAVPAASAHGAPAQTGSAQVTAVVPASEHTSAGDLGNVGPAHAATEPAKTGKSGLAPGDPEGDFVGTPADDATEDPLSTTTTPAPGGSDRPDGDRRLVEIRLLIRPDDYGTPGTREV